MASGYIFGLHRSTSRSNNPVSLSCQVLELISCKWIWWSVDQLAIVFDRLRDSVPSIPLVRQYTLANQSLRSRFPGLEFKEIAIAGYHDESRGLN